MREAVVSGDFSNTARQSWVVEPDAERGGSLMSDTNESARKVWLEKKWKQDRETFAFARSRARLFDGDDCGDPVRFNIVCW